jgi:hypothetical protein
LCILLLPPAIAGSNKVKKSARLFSPFLSVSVTPREELLELRLSGELFHLELRDLQFTLLFQLPPNLGRGLLLLNSFNRYQLKLFMRKRAPRHPARNQ